MTAHIRKMETHPTRMILCWACVGMVTLGMTIRDAAAGVGDVVSVISPQPPSAGNWCSIGVAFDGQDLYFDRCDDPNIYRISAADGSLLSTFDTGVAEYPNALAFDAKRNGMWFGCQVCDGVGMPIHF